MKIIYGVVQADAGEIRWDGEPVDDRQPRARAAARHRHGVPALLAVRDADGAENIALGGGRLAGSRRCCRERIDEVSQRYGLPLDPRRLVHTLSVGERQRVEIVRCLLQNPQLLIMDEPTSVLTPQAVDKLFETLRQLAAEGCSILYISHKLDEIQALCDTRDRPARRQGDRATATRAGDRRRRWRS